ncbi:putative oxidoreductase [Helianthus debilis subsp. tardiflorus]
MEVTNKFITIKATIYGEPQESDFELKIEPFSLSVKVGSNDVIIKNLYISIDPYQINRMKTVSSSQKTSKFSTQIAPGLSGLTAYAGFIEICKPKKGEKVFVSAASGSVGNLVGQYAKILGCYVVGCAGSADKVKLLKEKLGFDEVFNYKEETDLNSTLERCFPDGIDIYFDNVGGKMLEAVISNMNLYGRVALCGVISEYKDVGKRASPNMLNVIYKRITIQGFLSGDYMHLFPEFISITVDHLRTRKMHMFEDISIGLESVPTAFVGLFREYNVGKKIVQVSDDLGDK